GCGRRISSGLKWAFDQVEEAIVFEDDTLPSQSFFPFCQELLERYRDDERIVHISGNNYAPGQEITSRYRYRFSRYDHIWGWATWRRAFQNYDFEMKLWPRLKQQGWLAGLFGGDNIEAKWWEECFDQVFAGDRSVYDSWDMQLIFAYLVKQGLSIT